jgi:hypothetical protein
LSDRVFEPKRFERGEVIQGDARLEVEFLDLEATMPAVT